MLLSYRLLVAVCVITDVSIETGHGHSLLNFLQLGKGAGKQTQALFPPNLGMSQE